ncbi:MAG: hypothetical protein HRF42_12610 [Candidatus Brocadia sp.]|jgi:hypothetical protein
MDYAVAQEQGQKGPLASVPTRPATGTTTSIPTYPDTLCSKLTPLSAKVELKPFYHQKEQRVDGHILVSVLAYRLLQAIELLNIAYDQNRTREVGIPSNRYYRHIKW